MKAVGLGIATVFFCLLASSCENPATLVMDPLSEAWYTWQGSEPDSLGALLGSTTYGLRLHMLDPDLPVDDQVARLVSKGRSEKASPEILIFPPRYAESALAFSQQHPECSVAVLGQEDRMYQGSRVYRFKLVEAEAWRELATSLKHFLDSSEQLRVQCFVVAGDEERNRALADLRNGLGADEKIADRVTIRSFETEPQTDELRQALASTDRFTITLLLMSYHSSAWMKFLPPENPCIVESGIGVSAHFPKLAASIDIPWNRAVQALAREISSRNGGNSQKNGYGFEQSSDFVIPLNYELHWFHDLSNGP